MIFVNSEIISSTSEFCVFGECFKLMEITESWMWYSENNKTVQQMQRVLVPTW